MSSEDSYNLDEEEDLSTFDLKSALEEAEKENAEIDNLKEKAMDELLEKFAADQANIIAETNEKYGPDIAKWEKSSDPRFAKLLAKLKENKEKELKTKIDALKAKQKTEKEALLKDFKEKAQKLRNETRVKHITAKLKSTIKKPRTPKSNNKISAFPSFGPQANQLICICS